MHDTPSLEIDGSLGEGGGQILRSSLALSLITGRSFRLRNIRARRAKPGLQPQHLTAVRAAAAIGQAHTIGATAGSLQLDFHPGTVRAGDYRFDIGTAGATALVLHTVYLPLALQPESSRLVFEGGTHNEQAPCFHFLDATWRAYMARVGIEMSLHLERPGFYPKGGGRFRATIAGASELRGLTLDTRPALTHASGLSASSGGLPDHIAERQRARAVERLAEAGITAELREEHWIGGKGTMLAVTFDQTAVPTMFFGLGALGRPAEAVADEAVAQAIAFRDAGAPVDEHSADQLLLPLSLAADPSVYRVSRVTAHLGSHIDVVRSFLARDIVCDAPVGSPGTVRIGALAR